MQVYNMEIAGLIDRIHRFMKEVHYSGSANVAAVSQADFVRYKSYLSALEQYLDHIVAQPILDLPKFNPTAIELDDTPALPMVENEAVKDIIRMYAAAVVELSNSQSARYSNGMIPQDVQRLRDIITNQRAFLDSYVSNVQPLDLVETVPSRDLNGPGAKGV